MMASPSAAFGMSDEYADLYSDLAEDLKPCQCHECKAKRLNERAAASAVDRPYFAPVPRIKETWFVTPGFHV